MEKTLKTPRGNISEVFASIQGEGLLVGTMQLFVRLAAPGQSADDDTFVLRTLPGARNHYARNPVSPSRLFQLLADTYPLEEFFSVAFIGDDPLHQPDFLADMLQILRNHNIATFMQTAGTPVKEYLRLAPLVNRWCIDLTCGSGLSQLRSSRALAKIIGHADPCSTYFRLAIDVDDAPARLLKMIGELEPGKFTLVLQPCALFPAHISDWDTGTITSWIQLFRPHFFEVRWIPQVHKLLRIL